MTTVLTLAERHRRKLDGMRDAVPMLDAALTAYARQHGGRFIRYGSSATGHLRISSDIDIIADFPDDRASVQACEIADALCFDHGLLPDSWPAAWLREAFLERALREGVVLA